MAQLSPGVEVKEYDLTNIIPAASSSMGAFVGFFRWGPVEQVQTVPSETKLAEWFGKPNASIPSVDFLTAATFLSYSGALKVVRVVNQDPAKGLVATNACPFGVMDRLVKNDTQIEDAVYDLDMLPMFFARYPGKYGNSLKVVVLTQDNFTDPLMSNYASMFDSAPHATNNEVHLLVLDSTGSITGAVDGVVERYAYIQTVAGSKKEDGGNNYIQDVVKSASSFIYVGNTVQINVGGVFQFDGGEDGAVPGDDEYVFGWDLFANQEDQEDISLLIVGDRSVTVAKAVCEIAITRKDCMAFVSPSRSSVVGAFPNRLEPNVIQFRNDLGVDSSFVVLTCNWKYVFNKYLDRYEWIPDCADIAGLCARTDAERDPWFSPAGYNRGLLKNTIKLAWNPDKSQRDALYKNGINPVVNFRGVGPMLYGDKTLQSRASAFDRINVRRLFILLERVISRASRYQLFEFNDSFTRAQFVSIVEPFLRQIQGRRGIYDFLVKCDEENNPPSVVDSNSFVGDIYVKPARSINFIQLNFVAVRSGVEFAEVVGKF